MPAADPVQIRASIDRQVTATIAALGRATPIPSGGGDSDELAAVHRELLRQLTALRERVARAQHECAEPRVLRAELATLLSFAGTLRADAEELQAQRRRAVELITRAELAERQEAGRLAAQRQEALRRRDVLQGKVVQMAEAIAHGDRRQCRRTVPVLALDRDIIVCSVGVATPKRRFRPRQFWLVTLTEARDDVLAIRT